MNRDNEHKTDRPVAAPANNALRARDKKRWARRVIYALLAAVVAAGVAVSMWPKPLPVDAVTVKRGPLRVTIDEPGRTRVRDRVVVSAPLAADLARIELRAGDRVERGKVIARMSPASAPLLDPRTRAEAAARLSTTEAAALQARAAVSRAEAAVDHARAEHERDKRLAEGGVVSPDRAADAAFELRLREEDLASARFGARRAAHEVGMARAALDRYEGTKHERSADTFEVPSPIDGLVLRVLQPNAGFVQPGTPLIELGDPSALEIVVDVLTPFAVRIPKGARVTLDRWGGPTTLAAHVRYVEPSATTRLSALGVEEQRVTAVIDLDEPRDRWLTLGDGFRVEAEITIWSDENALSAPQSAVFRSGDRWAAFVIEGGRAALRAVELGQRSARAVEIKSGLREGDRVVIHPSDRVTHGARVLAR